VREPRDGESPVKIQFEIFKSVGHLMESDQGMSGLVGISVSHLHSFQVVSMAFSLRGIRLERRIHEHESAIISQETECNLQFWS
jgi:hypothetical protein